MSFQYLKKKWQQFRCHHKVVYEKLPEYLLERYGETHFYRYTCVVCGYSWKSLFYPEIFKKENRLCMNAGYHGKVTLACEEQDNASRVC